MDGNAGERLFPEWTPPRRSTHRYNYFYIEQGKTPRNVALVKVELTLNIDGPSYINALLVCIGPSLGSGEVLG